MWVEMDDYCKKFFWFLWVKEGKIRFNELYNSLKKVNVKVSKPTLIVHLKHLQDRGLIVRRVEDVQNVSYAIDWENLETLKDTLRFKEPIFHFEENRETFKSFSPRERLLALYDILLLGQLYRMKQSLADILEPEKKADHYFANWFVFKTLEFYASWFLESFMEADEETRKLLIAKLDGSIEILREAIVTSEKQPET